MEFLSLFCFCCIIKEFLRCFKFKKVWNKIMKCLIIGNKRLNKICLWIMYEYLFNVWIGYNLFVIYMVVLLKIFKLFLEFEK